MDNEILYTRSEAVRFFTRRASLGDVPALRALIPASVRALSAGFYTLLQVESAIRHVFGPDTQLIADGTYFDTEVAGHGIVGCGGWSRRRTLYGGDQMKGNSPHAASDDLLDPVTEPARIRAFFVAPGWERRGLATRLMAKCMEEIKAAGFYGVELVSTLPGVALYRRWGFIPDRCLQTRLPDGTEIAFIQMSYKIAPHPAA